MAKLYGSDREKALSNGQITDHPPKLDDQVERIKKAAPETQPRHGASDVYADVIAEREIRAKRHPREKRDPSAHQEFRRINRREAVDRALERLEPKALKVLEQQLKSPDERVKQNAAIRILEWARGKPGSSISIASEHTHTIKYETVAFGVNPVKADIELPAGSVEEDVERG